HLDRELAEGVGTGVRRPDLDRLDCQGRLRRQRRSRGRLPGRAPCEERREPEEEEMEREGLLPHGTILAHGAARIGGMKEGIGRILRIEQEQYVERLLPPRAPILAEMEQVGAQEGIPISDPEVGRLLEVLARASGARTIVEVGTAIGYGTLCLARGAPE